MKIRSIITAMLLLVASFSWAQNDNCTGTLTDNVEIDGGTPFVNGYEYYFYTIGDQVTANFTLLDDQVGLVAFYQTLNPNFSESGPFFPEPGTQTVSATFSGFSPGDTFSMRIKFSYAGGFSTGDTLTYIVGDNCGIEPPIPPQPLALPLTFETPGVDYTFENFGGGVSSVIANPDASGINLSDSVGQMVKNPGEVFGGSVIPLDGPIDFSTNRNFEMKVWSPRVGARVLLKVENAGNPGIFFEKEDTSTVANEWETLSFDFNAINAINEYSRIVLIWDLGVVGDGSPNFTFYFDDIELVEGGAPPAQVALPITFEDNTLDYGLTDFGGTVSALAPDPVDPSNTVVQTIRTAGSQVFAGTTVGQPLGLEEPIPFDFDNTGMSARVWSPEAGVIVKLKIEQVGNPGIFVEKDVLTTTSGAWETLEFDFAQPTAGSLNLDLDYNLPTIFFNFGADPGTTPEQTYFFDDIDFAPGVGGFIPTALPIDFDTPDVTFGLIDFGGNVSTVIPDPEDPANNVVQSIRTEGAEFFAGTTVPAGGLTNRIPFAEGETTMSIRVWSPEAGVPVRMKLEATGAPGLVAEKELTTTTSGEWETIFFDFSVDALVPVDVNADFNIVSLFFNFDVDQVNPAPEQIYLWDDIAFGGIPSSNCLNTSSFGSADILAEGPNGQLITIATNSWQTEYSTITGVPAGEDIEFNYDSPGAYITVRADSFDGDIVAEGFAPLTVNGASGSDLFAHWNTDDSCGTATDGNLTTVQCLTCPTICPEGNPGDACDDGNPLTEGETLQEDCSCGGGVVVPENDNCDGAIALACDDSINGTTEGANEAINSLSGCGFAPFETFDVWYSFEANGVDNYTVTVDAGASSTSWDGVLYVYSGTCESLVEVGCSDETFGGGSESVTLTAPAAGTYYVQFYDYSGFDTYTVSLACESGCANPYPAVDEASLTSTTLPDGDLRFEWEPIPGQIGCQINIVVGTGPQQTSRVVFGGDAGSFTAPANQLVPFTTYNFRVRCGCSQGPLVAGPFTDYAQAFYMPGAITEEMGTGYSDTPLSQIDEDVQWNNSNLNENVVGDLFNMASSESWVRVAPNPAQDNVSLTYNSLSEGLAFIRVFDAQGKLAFERTMTFNKGMNNVNLNLNELENGIYIVEVLKDDSRESVRLLMQ